MSNITLTNNMTWEHVNTFVITWWYVFLHWYFYVNDSMWETLAASLQPRRCWRWCTRHCIRMVLCCQRRMPRNRRGKHHLKIHWKCENLMFFLDIDSQWASIFEMVILLNYWRCHMNDRMIIIGITPFSKKSQFDPENRYLCGQLFGEHWSSPYLAGWWEHTCAPSSFQLDDIKPLDDGHRSTVIEIPIFGFPLWMTIKQPSLTMPRIWES